MDFPLELRMQIGKRNWRDLSKQEKLVALAWAMEGVLMRGTGVITSGERRKLNGMERLRRRVLKDFIKDKE